MKQLINNLAVLTGVLVLTQLSYAQEIEMFSLEKAKTHAIEHHIDIVNAGHDVESSRKQYKEYFGMGLPQIEFTGNFNHNINLPVQVVDATLFNPFAQPGELMEFRMGQEFTSTGSLTANQMIFNGSYIIGLQVAQKLTDFQKTIEQSTKQDVAYNVIQAYQLTAIAKENKIFADSMVLLTQNLVDKQQHFLDLDLMLQEDMDQLSYSLLTAKNAAVAADIQLQNTLSLLKLSMGYPMEGQIDITETPKDLITSSLSSEGDIHGNLTYQLLTQQVELTEYNLKNNKFANLPSLYAFFSQSYSAYRSEFNFFADEKWYPQTVWGLQLKVPIFSGLSRHAKVQQTEIALLKDQNKVAQMEETLKFQEIQAKNNLKGANDQFDLQKQNVDLARSIYHNAITKENIGKGNSMTVTQKHNQLMIAQSQYLGAMVELFKTQLDLDKLYNELLSNK